MPRTVSTQSRGAPFVYARAFRTDAVRTESALSKKMLELWRCLDADEFLSNRDLVHGLPPDLQFVHR